MWEIHVCHSSRPAYGGSVIAGQTDLDREIILGHLNKPYEPLKTEVEGRYEKKEADVWQKGRPKILKIWTGLRSPSRPLLDEGGHEPGNVGFWSWGWPLVNSQQGKDNLVLPPHGTKFCQPPEEPGCGYFPRASDKSPAWDIEQRLWAYLDFWPMELYDNMWVLF